MSPAYQTPNLILIKCCFFNKVDCYNNNVLGRRVLAPDKRIVFGPPSSFKGKLISLSKLDIFSLGKAIEANTYIVLGLKGKFYTGDNQKCSCISFFSSKNRVSSTNLESCHNGKVFFFRRGGEYTVLGKGRKTFPGSVVFFFFFQHWGTHFWGIIGMKCHWCDGPYTKTLPFCRWGCVFRDSQSHFLNISLQTEAPLRPLAVTYTKQSRMNGKLANYDQAGLLFFPFQTH